VSFPQGITEAKVDKVLEAINKEKSFSFISGSQVLRNRQRVKRITTGCKSLDALLGGGIESASLTEIFGEFRTGKTQVLIACLVTLFMLRDSSTSAKARAASPSFPHQNMQQWVHTLCVTAMLPTSMGGGHGKVAIIDTEGGFRPEKIGPIAERFGVKGEVSLFFKRAIAFL
jgi:meiotic recombination protein DMC1